MFIGDALAMPVHWYYDRAALRRDYGLVIDYVEPRNPHPGSILWRSKYEARNGRGDILREQAKYWGRRDVHYHQFLATGENTLNLQLAAELMDSLAATGHYVPADAAERYVRFMLEPGRHRDTYVEECHRNFFARYAEGLGPWECAAEDIHIGGLACLAPLVVRYRHDPARALEVVRKHLHLTHRGDLVTASAEAYANLLLAVLDGTFDVRTALAGAMSQSWLRRYPVLQWLNDGDEAVIGSRLSPACYLDDAWPATLFLAAKYQSDFAGGLIANTNLGGDNCHRGAVLGAILGAALGEQAIPSRWISGLVAHGRYERLIEVLAGRA
ncbi:hypothetical protein AYO41_05125 [Verrucomicrobia bacterium SCGC AG-212-E04]|nr:hypothetical protein AYO41_05125 [Verrucomicrobia bacterium SCGC AG-212-E04]